MNILENLLNNKHLSYETMQKIMLNIMHGHCSNEWLAAFLVAMRAKGITCDELLASIEVMKKIVTPVKINCSKVVDVVGTGGDGIHSFNVSTASMIVASACGAKVAKHGNRGISSKSGSADVLETLGINLHQNAHQIAQSIHQHGLGFMFAPNHHPAMKHVASVRKTLGIQTYFNVLGPLTNPAGVKRMLMGVYSKEWLEVIARVLLKLNFEHAFVVHAENGMDEVSSGVKTYVYEVKNNSISNYVLDPSDYGFKPFAIQEIYAKDSKRSAQIILDVLNGKTGPCFDMVTINAAIVLYISDLVENIEQGIEVVRQAILDKKALNKLNEFRNYTNTP